MPEATERMDALAKQMRSLQRQLSVCEKEIERLIRVVSLMGQAGLTLEGRVEEIEADRKPSLVIPVGVKPS